MVNEQLADDLAALIGDLQAQLHKGVMLQKETPIGSDLHHRMNHRMKQLREIIQKLIDEQADAAGELNTTP